MGYTSLATDPNLAHERCWVGWSCLCLLNVLLESTTVGALSPAKVESTTVSHFSKNKLSPKSYYVDGECRAS